MIWLILSIFIPGLIIIIYRKFLSNFEIQFKSIFLGILIVGISYLLLQLQLSFSNLLLNIVIRSLQIALIEEVLKTQFSDPDRGDIIEISMTYAIIENILYYLVHGSIRFLPTFIHIGMGVIYLKNRKLWQVVLLHFIYDFVVLLSIFKLYR